MVWYFSGEGSWEADSRITANGSTLYWRIVVCDDGTFDVFEPCDEITNSKETFPTLSDAKRWCEQQEQIQCEESCKPLPENLLTPDAESYIKELETRIATMNDLFGEVRRSCCVPPDLYRRIDAVMTREVRS